MDERRLTAWLITERVLASDQVKTLLEEQIRLQRAGTALDVIGVARRLKLLTDEQVLQVVERTGYRPAAEGLSAAPPARSETGAVDATDASADLPALDASDEGSVADLDALAGAGVTGGQGKPGASSGARVGAGSGARAGTGSGARKKPGKTSGSRSASSATASRILRQPSGPGGLVAALVVVPLLIVVLLAVPKGDPPPPIVGQGQAGASTPGAGDGPRGLSVSDAANQLMFADLLHGLSQAESQPARAEAERTAVVVRLRGLLGRLRASSLAAREKSRLDQAEARLTAIAKAPLAEGPAGGPSEVDPEWFEREGKRVAGARVDQAWAQMAGNFERILWLCLAQPRSPIQLGAEQVRGVDLRKVTSDGIAEFTRKGPDGIASLVGADELHPVLGVGGYDALLRECERFPEDLKRSERWERWKALVPRLEALRERAAAYARALRQAEDAADRGDLAQARSALDGGPYREDAWWTAARRFLESPDVAAALAARRKELEGGAPTAGRTGGLPLGGATATAAGKNWRERFLELSRRHKKAPEPERQGIVGDLQRLLDETLALAKGSFEQCADIVGCYDGAPAVFKAEASLVPPLKAHHELYFDGAFARASGPQSYRALDDWCADHGYEAWRARLKPYLRLVAGAQTPVARQREAARRARAQTQEQVLAYARDRVGQVAAGLATVLDWMRQRSFAPDAAKRELEDLVARAVLRAGDPVSGGRLREEVRALTHEPGAADPAELEKGYRKQLDLVIQDAVAKSIKGVERCLAANEPGLAFDLFQYVLLLDPENDRAHKGLGHVKVDGKWVRRFEAEELKRGFAWDGTLGWVKNTPADRGRYEKGEYFDRQEDRWTTLAEANQRHADPASPWVVKTEHFELRSTADLPKTTKIAERLEAFYLSLFRQYDLFFAAKGASTAALIFGVSPVQQAPLVVHFYRDEAQFRAHARPSAEWAAGFYDGGRHASFFYDMGNAYSITVLQHEVVHQILGESSPGAGAESWLAEGAAVYLEDAFFRDGVLTLGEKKDHSRVVAYESSVRAGRANEHSFREVLAFRTGRDWDSGDISKNYRGAGAVVYFLCNFDGGRYRSDFVEFLRDQYFGRNPRIEDYFGLSPQTLEQLMLRFYDPKAQVELGGGAVASLEDLNAARDALVAVCGAKELNLDQVSLAYGLFRDAVQSAPEKDAKAARSRVERALVTLRKKLLKTVQDAAKREQTGSGRAARYQELQRLRAAALGVINDPSRYPEENHGKAGQHLVDAAVNELRAVWQSTPKAFEDPEVVQALEVLEATEPWLVELEVDAKKQGETAANARRMLLEAASMAGLAMTPAEQARLEQDKKVRAYNDSRTDLPEDCREQVRILNDYRAMLGLHALAIDTRLYQAALKHSEWMERTGRFAHESTLPGRVTPADRCRAEGYESGVGENIAFGYPTAESVHNGWYNSSGHHRNMVSAGYHQIGVGRAGTYWTQNFGMGKPSLP